MIYSAVDLIRKADTHQTRAEKRAGPQSVSPAGFPKTGDRDPDQGGALLRFARFVNQEKRKKPATKSAKHLYARALQSVQQAEDIGQLIDIYV